MEFYMLWIADSKIHDGMRLMKNLSSVINLSVLLHEWLAFISSHLHLLSYVFIIEKATTITIDIDWYHNLFLYYYYYSMVLPQLKKRSSGDEVKCNMWKPYECVAYYPFIFHEWFYWNHNCHRECYLKC